MLVIRIFRTGYLVNNCILNLKTIKNIRISKELKTVVAANNFFHNNYINCSGYFSNATDYSIFLSSMLSIIPWHYWYFDVGNKKRFFFSGNKKSVFRIFSNRLLEIYTVFETQVSSKYQRM